MRIIRGVLFDLDGTLLDSKERFYESYVQALADFGLPTITRDAFERHYHLDELSHRLPEGEALREDFWRRFLTTLTSLDHETQFAYPGVPEALARLREAGYAMAVCTARLCPEESVRRELDHLGMLGYFDDVLSNARIAAREGWDRADSSSKKTIIEEAAASIGLAPPQTAFVGDWVGDIRSAKAAGCALNVAVLSSGYKAEILQAEGPDAILPSAADLPELLASIPDMIGPGYLAIDREGRWLNDGVEITHPKTLESFWKWLDRDARGKYVVRAGREECPVHVQVTPYFVRRVDVGPDGVTLLLSDGTAEPLDPGTLRLYEDRFLHCRVKGGAHEARFGRAAWHDLARMIERDPRGDGVFLALGGARYPIAT
jgi:phosphoglycolate phosphatase-like HAD superfamily hydrolase